jgi:arylsulfatase A-like enzyme
MKAIMVMFDSLNRHMLPPYGCEWTHAPNFARLAQHSVTFDNCYVASMPCMPARRELHTGRYNFLHRSWGPLEPFDDSMPELLKDNSIYTHLVTDHQHYWEDGGGTYHYRYNTFEFVRGQEGEPWKGHVGPVAAPASTSAESNHPKDMWRQDWINRSHIHSEAEMPQAQTFALGMEFIRENAAQDHWFLQLETFDPHEPFFSQQAYKDLYPHEYNGPHFDWPPYYKVTETPEMVGHARLEYAALLSMCDAYLGKVLDLMDELDLWKDTLLIVCTDHGYLLGEHDWWAKIVQPMFNEIAHTPLFIWDPRCGLRGERRQQLVQIIDFAPTLLEFFGVPIPKDMQGLPLRDVIAKNAPTRDAILFGVHGAHVNVFDGRYIYMRSCQKPDNTPLYEYTLMPTHMRKRFGPEELQNIQLAEPFTFTKGCRTMKITSRPWINPAWYGTLLYDLQNDPEQKQPMQDPAVEARMTEVLVQLMQANEAPAEQYTRLGLEVQ